MYHISTNTYRNKTKNGTRLSIFKVCTSKKGPLGNIAHHYTNIAESRTNYEWFFRGFASNRSIADVCLLTCISTKDVSSRLTTKFCISRDPLPREHCSGRFKILFYLESWSNSKKIDTWKWINHNRFNNLCFFIEFFLDLKIWQRYLI